MSEVDPNVSTLTDAQERIMSILGVISGSLSFLGSSVIVYRVYKNRTKTTPYDRIMLGLSLTDMVASFSFACGPLMLPAETSTRAWASGNDRTCTALGFLTQFAFAAVWYNGLLSVYYLMTVRFGVKREAFAKKYEPYMHGLSLAFFLSTAISGLIIGLYSELEVTQGCWIGEYPENCEETDSCRGTPIGWIFGGLPFLFTFFSLPINNIIIFVYVRQRLGAIPGVETASSRHRQEDQRLRIREVASQGFFYVSSFYICYTPAFIIRVLEGLGLNGEKESDIFPVLVLNSLLLPLQGFLNVFIYSRPNYLRVKNAYPEQSKLWHVRECLMESDIPALTVSRNLYSSQISAGAQRSANQKGDTRNKSRKSQGSSFGGSLDVVREDSKEDKSSSAFDFGIRKANNARMGNVQQDEPFKPSSSQSSRMDSNAVTAADHGNQMISSGIFVKPLRVNMDGSLS